MDPNDHGGFHLRLKTLVMAEFSLFGQPEGLDLVLSDFPWFVEIPRNDSRVGYLSHSQSRA